MAGLGWIHFSDTTRRQVLKIIDILGEPGTIDELGIGVVRNAFSNEMFKGMSTIQTRARYFYFVPYLLIDYLREKQKVPVHTYMKKAEMALLEELTKHYEHPENERIIGYTIAQQNISIGKPIKDLVRKPSEIYWGGLRTYGIFKKTHSFHQLCDAINKGAYTNKSKDNNGNDIENGDDNLGYEKWSEIFDVPYHSNWSRVNMSLTVDEANHLLDHISNNLKGSLITELLQIPSSINEFLEMKNFEEMLSATFFNQLSKHNQKVIKTAVQFWDLLEGAHIRFNVLLQNKPTQKEPISFNKEWEVWKHKVMNHFDWNDFDRDFLWRITTNNSNIKYRTKDFINNWFDGIKNKANESVLDDLVRMQEMNNKKERSKLASSHTDNYKSWVGIDKLSYRLANVQTIVRDIATPLGFLPNA